MYIVSLSKKNKTDAVDGKTEILPYDELTCELFYPDKNKETTTLVLNMAVEVAQCLLKDLCDPKKAMLDYLTSKYGVFSWGKTTDNEHKYCVTK